MAVLFGICWLGMHHAAAYQSAPPVDIERGLWNREFGQQREPGASGPAPRSGPMLGVTAWILHESIPADRTRALVHETSAGPVHYTPERLGADAQLSEGDRIRISIEPGRPGFLYVISRETYSDGSHGDPSIIFPTAQIRGGRNDVRPGAPVEIPEFDNPTPFFTLRRGRPDETGEQVFVLLSPRAIPEIRVASGAQPISAGMLEGWIRKWGGKARMLDAPALKGAPLSQAERNAAAQSTRLTSADPVPQLLFRTSGEGEDTLLAEYTLRIRQ
jgi:hypothetical protein